MSPSRSRLSIPDELAKLEAHVRRRMTELAPLVHEYRELEQIANRLGLEIDARNGAGPSVPNGLLDGRRATIHVPAGRRHQQLLALIRERPGITVREAAQELGVDPTSLYRIVRRLVADRDVEKRGRSLHPL